jgi:hypothetical protein
MDVSPLTSSGAGVGYDFVDHRQGVTFLDLLDVTIVLNNQNGRILNDVIEGGGSAAITGIDIEYFQMVRPMALLKVTDEIFDDTAMFGVRSVKDKDFHALSL